MPRKNFPGNRKARREVALQNIQKRLRGDYYSPKAGASEEAIATLARKKLLAEQEAEALETRV